MPGMLYSSYVEERSADYQDVITIHIAMPESPHSEKMLEIVIQNRWRGARTWQRKEIDSLARMFQQTLSEALGFERVRVERAETASPYLY
jgi:hypothetical protein